MNPVAPFVNRRQFALGGACAALVVAQGIVPLRDALAQAAPPGDVFKLLEQEHRQVEQLFGQLLKTGNSDAQQRSELLGKLNHALTLHGLQEENVVYLALRQAGEESEASELFREHADIKYQLFALDSAPKNEDAWLDRVREFEKDVNSHVEDEEKDVFPQMREKLGADKLGELNRMMQLVTKKWS